MKTFASTERKEEHKVLIKPTVSNRTGNHGNKVKIEVNLSQLTKVPKLTDIDNFSLRQQHSSLIRN